MIFIFKNLADTLISKGIPGSEWSWLCYCHA